MSEMSELVSSYKAIRDRLISPPNAITDIGIDLKRKRIPPTVDKVSDLPVVEYVQGPAVDCSVFVVEIPTPMIEEPLKLEDIERAVCSFFGVSKIELYARRRTKNVVYARHICWYLATKYTSRSLPEIGRRGGGCDHTTILHARDKIERLIKEDVETADTIKMLESMLMNRHEANCLSKSAVATITERNLAQEQADQEGSLPRPKVCPVA